MQLIQVNDSNRKCAKPRQGPQHSIRDQPKSQQLDIGGQEAGFAATVENDSSDDEEIKAQQSHELSIVYERVSEEDSWADQSKIGQFLSQFNPSISCSNVPETRVSQNSFKSLQQAAEQGIRREFARSMPKFKTEKHDIEKKWA